MVPGTEPGLQPMKEGSMWEPSAISQVGGAIVFILVVWVATAIMDFIDSKKEK